MLQESEFYCPDCDNGFDAPQIRNRRNFIRSTAALAVGAAIPTALSAQEGVKPIKPGAPKPAEEFIRELHASLTAEQKGKLVLPWDHQAKGGKLSRLGAYNNAFGGLRLGEEYDEKQQGLVRRALRSILSSDEAVERLSRYGRWDSSGSFEGCGAVIFGDPSGDKPFAWVFSGHHLTLRCDGNSVPGAAFGGPIYYGHSSPGHSDRNVYNYQTQAVQAVYDALDAGQRKQAVAEQNPGDGVGGVRFPKADAPKPGIGYADLNAEQKQLVENVMRTLLGPFREEDTSEVMDIVKANGGMEKIHLAFYRENQKEEGKDKPARWHFWRLEGPGFIWNYRVLPHVHCFVNIANQPVAA